jgi:NitT/TauT family transport system permease protein
VVYGGFGLLMLLVVWWVLTVPFTAPNSLVAHFAPVPSLQSLFALLGGADNMWLHIGVSLKRVAVALILALAVGVPLGLVLGRSRTLNATLSPAFQFLRMVSPLSWMPIAVIAFGIGDRPIYFLLAFAAVWPIMLSTMAGVRAINPRWQALGKSLAASATETFWQITVPAITGHVLTGVRLAIGVLWIVLVPCEMLGVTAGLGYFILDTRDRLDYPALMATIVLIGVLGFLLDGFFRSICQLRKAA